MDNCDNFKKRISGFLREINFGEHRRKSLLYQIKNFFHIYYYDPLEGRKKNLRKSLRVNNRMPGVSGFMRLRNEGEFVGQVIESVIGSLDELVIVYNQCTDDTEEIVKKKQKKYAEKIFCYHYQPEVYAQGTDKMMSLPPDSKHSLVNYCNFSLAKTTRQIAVKVDGDCYYLSDKFKKLLNDIKHKGMLNKYYIFWGVNLWDDNGSIKVNGNKPLAGGLDCGIFRVSCKTYFIKGLAYELFVYNYKVKDIGILFYHLKGMKKDRGISIYQLDAKNQYYKKLVMNAYNNPRLIAWKTWIKFEDKQNTMYLINPNKPILRKALEKK